MIERKLLAQAAGLELCPCRAVVSLVRVIDILVGVLGSRENHFHDLEALLKLPLVSVVGRHLGLSLGWLLGVIP